MSDSREEPDLPRSIDSVERFATNGVPLFLGTSLRAVRHLFGWDLTRVSSFVLVPFFPLRIPDIALVMAVRFSALESGFTLQLMNARRASLMSTIEVSVSKKGNLTHEYLIKQLQLAPQVLLPTKPQTEIFTHGIVDSDASHILFVVPCPGFQVLEPTQIRVEYIGNGVTHTIGKFSIEFLKTPELSNEEVKEVRRRGRENVATLRVVCTKCNNQTMITKGLTGAVASIKSSLPQISVDALPSTFDCGCGDTRFDTHFLKLGMHEIFRHTYAQEAEQLRLAACYQPTALASVISQYRKLIESEPPEETVQEFLTQTPIMWSFLGPVIILPKPRLSTHLTADFAILTYSKALYFVEIEKPQTKLVKQKGGQAAELQAGKDQIDAWRLWIEDHRSAVLQELRFDPSQVHAVKFILVAGLESQTPSGDLRAVREGIKEDTTFYTFDDLSGFVRNIETTTRHM